MLNQLCLFVLFYWVDFSGIIIILISGNTGPVYYLKSGKITGKIRKNRGKNPEKIVILPYKALLKAPITCLQSARFSIYWGGSVQYLRGWFGSSLGVVWG